MKVFVISMQRSGERRVHMASHLEKLEIPFEFWDATDGRALDTDDIAKWVDVPALKAWARHGEVRAGEIGCAISHWRLWRHVVDQKIKHALIFEDDINIQRPDIVDITRTILRYLQDREIVLLQSEQSSTWVFNRVQIDGNEKLVYANGKATCTAAYLITQSAAQALCADLDANRIRFPIDTWCHQSRPSFSRVIRTRLLIPNPVIQRADIFSSTIQIPKATKTPARRVFSFIRQRLNAVRDVFRSLIPPRRLVGTSRNPFARKDRA